MRCKSKNIKGSGSCKRSSQEIKPTVSTNSLGLGLGLDSDMQALLAARAAQDARYFPLVSLDQERPVEPNPPAPRSVSGPGNASTTTTSSQGLKSAAAICTSRSCVLIE